MPLGRNSRIRPLAFSLEPRCQGLWGVAKEDVHVQSGAERRVQGHLRALVVGHGLAQARRDGPEAAAEAFEHVGGAAAVELDEHHVATGALCQRSRSTPPGADAAS